MVHPAASVLVVLVVRLLLLSGLLALLASFARRQ
jgi:hypothetical protein